MSGPRDRQSAIAALGVSRTLVTQPRVFAPALGELGFPAPSLVERPERVRSHQPLTAVGSSSPECG